MARIKTFQGSGPNPNVPFAGDMPRPQFIGQVDDAVGRLANNINKEAQSYMQLQKKQTDAAAIAQADAAKIMFQAELDGSEDLYDEKGNIKLDLYKERVDSFYDNAQTNMSSDAFKSWKNTQTVLDARRMGSLMSENMKRTREANQFNTLQSIEIIGSNSLTGSFQDMQDSSLLIKRNIDDAIESGIIELSQGAKLEAETFKKLSRSYIDNLKESVSGYGAATSDINKAYDSAMTFVNADPFGVFSRDEGLKNAMRQSIQTDRLKAIKDSQQQSLQMESLRNRVLDESQDRNYNQLMGEGYELFRVQNDPTAMIQYQSKIDQLVKTNQLKEPQARELKTLNLSLIESKDNDILSVVSTLSNDEDATSLISRITDPKKIDLALRVNKLTPDRKALINNLKSINNTEFQTILRDFSDKEKMFDEILEKEPDNQYDERDLLSAYYFKYSSDDVNSKSYRNFRSSYARYLRSKNIKESSRPDMRAKQLMNKLDSMFEKAQTERGK